MSSIHQQDESVPGNRQLICCTLGEICYRHSQTLLFKIARITYERYDDEGYQYVFEPYYDVIDGLCDIDYGGIPGIDLSLRKIKYYRVDTTPVFISERTPSETRVDVRNLIMEAGLEYLNRLEWLVKTDHSYSGDRLVVKNIDFNNFTGINEVESQWYALSILKMLGMRQPITILGKTFPDHLRAPFIRLYLLEYDLLSRKRLANQRIGQEDAKDGGIYHGRKPIAASVTALHSAYESVRAGRMTVVEAMQATGLSRTTLYRRFKRLDAMQSD